MNKTIVYSYDNAGNITSKVTYALTAEGVTPSSPISTDTYGYSSGQWGDLRVGYDGRIIDVQIDLLTAKFFCIYDNGRFKPDPGFGLVDLGFSIDIVAIIEILKGNG